MTDLAPVITVFVVDESASGGDFIPVVETQEDNPAGSRSRNRLPTLAKAKLIAVLIDSPIVGLVWFALDDGFQSGDEIPVFYASELPHLAKMSGEELQKEYERKLALGGGWIRNKIEGPVKH